MPFRRAAVRGSLMGQPRANTVAPTPRPYVPQFRHGLGPSCAPRVARVPPGSPLACRATPTWHAAAPPEGLRPTASRRQIALTAQSAHPLPLLSATDTDDPLPHP